MRHPILKLSDTKEYAEARISPNLVGDIEIEPVWVGSGHDVDLDPLGDVLTRMRDTYQEEVGHGSPPSAEGIEGRYSGDVHAALRDLPIETLDDPGFWRFLSMEHFWWFIELRESGPISRGNVLTYVDGGRECVPFRMFLRGQVIRDGDDYSLASAIPSGADFWRSHILRVRTGTSPALARSLVRFQAAERLPSTVVRPFARQLNRLWSNVVFDIWTEEECDQMLRDLYGELMIGGAGNPFEADEGSVSETRRSLES